MKKKLIQILMLLVVAVSIGAFVSCKDTNEDLYNELRNDPNLRNETLATRLATLQAQLDALKPCTCDKNLRTDLNAAQADIAGILATLAGLKTNTDGTIDLGSGTIGGGTGAGAGGGITLDDLIGDLKDLTDESGDTLSLVEIWNYVKDHTTSITNINKTLNEYGTNITNLLAQQEESDSLITDLQDQLDKILENIKQCDCNAKFDSVWKAVNKLEMELAMAKDKAEAALDLAKRDSVAIIAVQNLAELANTAAKNAIDAAAIADSIARKAEGDAAKAKETAEDAKKLAEQALALETRIITLEAKVAKNEGDIQTLNGHITRIDGLISTLESKVNTNTEDIKNIKKDLEDVKAYKEQIDKNTKAIENLQKAVNDLDGRITTVDEKAEEAFKKASEAYTQAMTNDAVLKALEPRVKANEEAIAALQGQMKDLKEVVDGHTTDIKTLKDNVNTINTDLADMKTKYENITKEIGDLKTELADCKATCAANLATAKAELEQLVATSIAAAKTAILDSLSYYYTKEEIDNMLSTLKVGIQGNTTTTIEDIEKILENLETGCKCDEQALKDAIDLIKKQLNEMWNQVDDNTENIGKNADAIDAINQTIADLINKTIKDMQENLETLNGNVEDLTIKQSQLELIVKKIKETYITKDEVKTITDAIIAKAEADSTNFKNRMDIIGDSVANVLSDLTALTARVEILENSNFATSDELAELQEALSDAIAANTTKIQKLTDQVKKNKDDIKTLKDDFKDLEERVKSAEDRLDKAEERLNKFDTEILGLKDAIKALQDNLAKQITGITIQGTYNPMFGSFSLPTGTQSNILLAYYGLPAADVEFPTSSTGKYVRPSEALTDKDIEMLGLSGDAVFTWPANMPMTFDKGYAGKIWMTINPNTVDCSGLVPTIVNSKDEESFITLKPIKASEEKLQFGWTRADQSNGFYEAEAYVSPTDVQKVNAPSFNTAAVADAAKNVRDALTEMVKNQSTTGNGNMPRLEKLASDVNSIVQGLKFDRSALKVSYTSEEYDDNGNKTEKEHSVYSQYNLAATAFQPLNLGTAKDFNYQTIPGYEKAFALLDKLSGKVNKKVHTFFYDFKNSALVEKVANLNIKDITIKDLNDDLLAQFILHMDTTFVMDGLSYHLTSLDAQVPIKFDKDLTIPVEIKGLEVEVPITWSDEISVDLDKAFITTPTVVVKGSATSHPTGVVDADGNDVASLLIPILDTDNNIVGVQEIPLDNFLVKVDIDASNESTNAGKKIYLNGQAFADITINETYKGKVDINDEIEYTLHIDEVINATIKLDKWFYFGDNGTDKKSFNLKFNYDMRDAAKNLWGEAQTALGGVNDMLADIRDIVKEVNKLVDKINNYEDKITGTIDDIVTRAKSYIDKINSVIVNLVNSTNERFQPFMVASTNKGMKFLSGSKNYPTKLTKDIKFFATSQTMELIVPMARKHVAVTNVFKGDASAQNGNSDCKSKLTAANSGEKMNVVLDGNERVIELKGLASGYVYEIAYSALDFQGKIATRKYYVTVE